MLHMLVLLLSMGGVGAGQQTPTPPPAASTKIDPPGELDKLAESCGAFKVVGCAEELLTLHPVHVAVGSIAPQNGVGLGVAFGAHKDTETWQTSWNADGVGSFNGSWRAGVYGRFVITGSRAPVAVFGRDKWLPSKANLTELPEHTVIGLTAQEISLSQLNYFGLGPQSPLGGQSVYGMREFIGGVSVVKPFAGTLHASVYGEINDRSVSIQSRLGQTPPSIEALYNDTTAPGRSTPRSFAQVGEGLRIRPVFFSDTIRLNYDISLRDYFAVSDARSTFHRLVIDLSHDIALYRSTTRTLLPREANGPDDCAISTDDKTRGCSVDTEAMARACRAKPNAKPSDCDAISRDLQGRVTFRMFLSDALTPTGHVVPFYFQPTLGGSDVNGDPTLASYQDSRFRAPTLLLLRQSFEHSIAGPIGFALLLDQGKVASSTGRLGASPWMHSASAGLTIRAAGAPQVYILYSRGGPEGTHTSFTINTALLGGTPRPSVF